nr:error-prone DNA polymerase [Oligoflexales bacterium]
IYKSALIASKDLAQRCHFSLGELRYNYPKEMLPENFSAQEFLEKITWEEAGKRYATLPDKIRALVKRELDLIKELSFADYFLTVWDIVSWARSQDILCQGRGSAANSAVCYVLGITSVDPALFDVLFERFISVERGDPPDIDVDFEHERREEVIQYIYARYGRAKAAMVANVITFQSRGALRAAGKALGVPELVLKKAAELLEVREFRYGGADYTVAELKKDLDLAGCNLEADNLEADNLEAGNLAGEAANELPLDLWAKMAAALDGFPSHLGIHSGGFILADKPLDWLVAQEPATMEDRTIIQWCKEDIEALGFFKIDILALGMLTAVRKCFSVIETHYARKLTLATIPQGDKATYDMICKADTVGTFQIESRAQMSMLPRLKPRCFYDLVIEVAIIRPGPIQGGMIHPYLKRRDGLEKVDFPDARLEPILKRTLGIPIFQEQVMRIAMAVGGFSPGDADELRRNIGSFSLKNKVELWVGKLAEGMRANKLPETFIESTLKQLKGFSSYGFPESHAASFALIVYVSCYLKCHYSAVFFLSVLNSQPMGFYPPHILIQTARQLGVEVLPICVRKSDWDHRLEKIGEKSAEPIYAIRVGFRLVRSLREEASKAFVARRKESPPWSDFEDFVRRSGLSRVDFTALAAADAFHSFDVERRSAIWRSEAAPFLEHIEDTERPLKFAAETNMEKVESNFHATSISLGLHPAQIIKQEQWHFKIPSTTITLATDIAKVSAGKRIIVFGMIIVRQAPPTAKGMVFATIEDETGLINVALTPQVYAKFKQLFNRQAFLCLSGRLQKQGAAHSIMTEIIYAPQIPEAKVFNIELAEDNKSNDILGYELVSARNYC